MSHPEGDDDKEHLEKGAEDHIARESKWHDAQERSSGAEHNGGADLSHGVSNTSILRDIRVLLSVGEWGGLNAREGGKQIYRHGGVRKCVKQTLLSIPDSNTSSRSPVKSKPDQVKGVDCSILIIHAIK